MIIKLPRIWNWPVFNERGHQSNDSNSLPQWSNYPWHGVSGLLGILLWSRLHLLTKSHPPLGLNQLSWERDIRKPSSGHRCSAAASPIAAYLFFLQLPWQRLQSSPTPLKWGRTDAETDGLGSFNDNLCTLPKINNNNNNVIEDSSNMYIQYILLFKF